MPSRMPKGSSRLVRSGASTPGSSPPRCRGSAIPTYEVTAGVRGLLGGSAADGATGVIVSPAVHETLGLAAGDRLVTVGGAGTGVAGVYDYPDDGRDPDLEYAVLAPAVDDGSPFDACWATVWPQRDDTVSMLRRTVLPASGADGEDRPTAGQLNPTLGAVFTPAARRPVLVPFGAAALVGLTIGGAAVARRRLALAYDRHVGVPRCAQVLGVVLQHLVWASVGAVVATSVAVVSVRGLDVDDALPIVREAIAIASLGARGRAARWGARRGRDPRARAAPLLPLPLTAAGGADAHRASRRLRAPSAARPVRQSDRLPRTVRRDLSLWRVPRTGMAWICRFGAGDRRPFG